MTNVTQTERMIQPTRLTLKIPNFSPDSDNISEVMERLEKILPYTGNQISPVIINFLQNSGLEHLLLSLNPNELSNFNDFKQAMVNRYGKSDDGNDFYLITQASGEHELDLLARIKRAWLRLKRSTTFSNADERIVYGRFVAALKDPIVRLKIREQTPSFQNVASFARQLRLAKEIEQDSPQHIKDQLALLTEDVNKLKLKCQKCGLGHSTEECRANSKMKSQYNKNVRNQKRRFFNRNFEIHKENSQATGHGRFPPVQPFYLNNNNNYNRGQRNFQSIDNRNEQRNNSNWRGRSSPRGSYTNQNLWRGRSNGRGFNRNQNYNNNRQNFNKQKGNTQRSSFFADVEETALPDSY